MRALFVTNQRKTEFYSGVARHMEAQGATMFFVSVGERWTRMLIDDGWSEDRILTLSRFGEEWSGAFVPTPEDKARVARIEAAGETSLKNVLIMDRELNRRPGLSVEPYIHVVTREIERFIRANGITAGFGESTWAPETLTAQVLRAAGGRYLLHHTLRVPSDRLAFYDGIRHAGIVEMRQPTDIDRQIARQAIRNLRERGEKPYYFASGKNPHRFRNHWIEEARRAVLEKQDARHDHTVPPLLARSVRRVAARMHAAGARRSAILQRAPAEAPRPFVLVTLHKQPEASVDVLGFPFNNQLETIRALARIMPFDWEIWVKEHTAAVGDRDGAYYRALERLPGVRLIDPNEDTMALVRRASLVASVAGTVCLEAAIMGVPAITFADMYFGTLLIRNSFDPYGTTHRQMAAILDEAETWRGDPKRDERIEDFVTWMVAQSFTGICSDPISAPACMETANLDRIASSTIAVLRTIVAKPVMSSTEPMRKIA